MDKIRAKREYGTANEMSAKNRALNFKIEFTLNQFNKIKIGVIPIEMGDRWFIFYENSSLYFHWWSGECIYKIYFEDRDSKVKTGKIFVTNDPSIKPVIKDSVEIIELKSIIKYSLLDGEEPIFVEM